MAKKTIIICDVSYLAWRSFYVFGGLEYRGNPTGVTFGILRDIRSLTEQFNTPDIAFCFDLGKPLRCKLFSGYKKKRNSDKKLPENISKFKGVRKEINLLRKEILPYLGFKNLFWEKGYEADDLIAQTTWNPHRNIIVSGDSDLYQLLNPNTSIYQPAKGKFYDVAAFQEEFKNLDPSDWPKVKALAGCSTDEIPGVRGVGDKTAVKFILNDRDAKILEPGSLQQQAYQFMSGKDYQRNLKLVTLPYPGLDREKCILQEQKWVDPKRWRKLAKKYGMKTLTK